MTFEPFVSAKKAAEFLGINPRLLLAMARKNLTGAYPIGTGKLRKTWVFKLSEVSAAIAPKRYDPISKGGSR